jgi:hypothetical protein
MLSAEKVMESHWHRLQAHRVRTQQAGTLAFAQPNVSSNHLSSGWHALSEPETQEVFVQAAPTRQVAIRVLTPKLAPLTQLAEEIADSMPAAQPAPKFRQDLQKALELSHRQRAAQRVLGTRPAPKKRAPLSLSQLGLALLLVAALALLLAWRRPTEQD